MCGRFAMTIDPARLALELDAVNETGQTPGPDYAGPDHSGPDYAGPDHSGPDYAGPDCAGPNYSGPNYSGPNYSGPNYNVAPSTAIAAVVARHREPDDDPTRRIRLMRWGLLPPWAKPGPDGGPPTKGPQLINARAETVTTSPAYRSAAAHKRCLIPMDGYYEWKPNAEHGATSRRGRKTPYFFYRPDGAPLLVAGLWSVWRPGPDTDPLLTCTVITTDAVGRFAAVHDRMPLVLAESDWDRWLDPDSAAPAELLDAAPDIAPLAMREVTTLVNNVANNGPELIEAPGPGNQPVGLF